MKPKRGSGRSVSGPAPTGSTPTQGSAGKKPRGPRLTERKKRAMLLSHDQKLMQHDNRLYALEQATRPWWRKMFD